MTKQVDILLYLVDVKNGNATFAVAPSLESRQEVIPLLDISIRAITSRVNNLPESYPKVVVRMSESMAIDKSLYLKPSTAAQSTRLPPATYQEPKQVNKPDGSHYKDDDETSLESALDKMQQSILGV